MRKVGYLLEDWSQALLGPVLGITAALVLIFYECVFGELKQTYDYKDKSLES